VERRALVLGTLAGQVDAMEALRGLGWSVHACGHVAHGPGMFAADSFHLVDVVDVDAVADLAAELGVGLVYSVGSDIAMPTVAAVSERLGLPRFHDARTTEVLHRKDLLRAFLAAAGLSPVVHRVARTQDDVAGFGTWPAIVKPTDSQGQRGITVATGEDEAVAALQHALAASRSGTAVVEELLAGPEVSVHVVVVEGQVRFFLPSDRHVWDGPLVGIPAAHTVPSAALDKRAEQEVRDLVDRFVAALGVRNGPLYFQLKLTPAGPRIIEVAPRLDGCHLWRLVHVHTGFDLLTALLRLLTGEGWADPAPWDDAPSHTLRFHLTPPGVPFRATDHAPPAETACYVEHQVDEGALPRDTNGVVCRVGYEIVEDR